MMWVNPSLTRMLWQCTLLMGCMFVCEAVIKPHSLSPRVEHFILGGKNLADCANDTYTFKRPKNVQKCVGEEMVYEKAAVACESTICSKVGRRILKKGGHAVDALIAVTLCIGVQNTEAAGIGGDLVMTVYDRKKKKPSIIEGRAIAPEATKDLSMFLDEGNRRKGPMSIAVPGAVASMQEAHNKYGKLPWKELFEPSIQMMKRGVRLDFDTADALVYPDMFGETMVKDIENNPELRKLYFNEKTGKPKEEGDFVFFRKLSRTYRRLAEYGVDDFYRGGLAKQIIRELAEEGGVLTKNDLANYYVERKEPFSDSIAGYKFYTSPPPSFSGIIPLYYRIFEGFNMTKHDLHGTEKLALTFHRFLEAGKFAYLSRRALVDPKLNANMTKIDKILSQQTADKYRKLIDDNVAKQDDDVQDILDRHLTISTTHISVIDEQGNAASATGSINFHMGSKVVGKQTGIVYNNLMNEFIYPSEETTHLSHFFPSPGKAVSISHMSPFIMVDKEGAVKFVGGSSGATRIPATIVQIFSNLFIFNKTLKEAVDDGRLYSLMGMTLVNPQIANKKVLQRLVDRGHDVQYYCYIPSGFHSVLVKDGKLHAYVDPLKFDCPAGY